jgi:hypothetical protein
MKIDYLTGTDAGMFAQTFILMQSFAATGSGNKFRICDFGLTEGQRRFLQERGQLATADPLVPEQYDHPWHRKAALGRYASPGADAVVWLDADMVVIVGICAEVEVLVAEMKRNKHAIAASADRDGFSIADFLSEMESHGGNVQPFRQTLAQTGVPQHHPYLNSGFFVAADRGWLADWEKTTFDTPVHLLFEQNAFNATAWRALETVLLLDARTWNVHGECLAELNTPDGRSLLCRDRPVVALHATSNLGRHHERLNFRWRLGGQERVDRMKLFRVPALRAMQLNLFNRFVDENHAGLERFL